MANNSLGAHGVWGVVPWGGNRVGIGQWHLAGQDQACLLENARLFRRGDGASRMAGPHRVNVREGLVVS